MVKGVVATETTAAPPFELKWAGLLLLGFAPLPWRRVLEAGRRLWVLGSRPCAMSFFLMHEFQKFLISLSVLPGSCDAIWDHLMMDQAQAQSHDVCYVAGM